MKKIFVTGTDTDVGKTFVSKLILDKLAEQGYSTGGFKPISAGCENTPNGLRNEDALTLQQAATKNVEYDLVNPIAYLPPIAPHIAAKQLNQSIDLTVIDNSIEQWQQICPDVLLTEGAGGWFLPTGNKAETLADWAIKHQMDVVLVVGLKLGCLNHALLTVEQIKQSGLNLIGWVANHISAEMTADQDNIDYLKQAIDAPLWGEVPYAPDSNLLKNNLSISL